MGRSTAVFLALAAMLAGPSAWAHDLDATDPNNGVSLSLGAGDYRVTYDRGAWNAWGGDTSCTSTSCHGWLNSFNIFSADGSVDDDVGAPFDGTWPTPGEAETLGRNASPFLFHLATAQTVKFFINDSDYSDNLGSISISVSPVPEPAAGAMLLAGLGLLGLRGRRKAAAVT